MEGQDKQVNPSKSTPKRRFASNKGHRKTNKLESFGGILPGNISVTEFNRRYRTKGPAFYAKEKADGRQEK